MMVIPPVQPTTTSPVNPEKIAINESVNRLEIFENLSSHLFTVLCSYPIPGTLEAARNKKFPSDSKERREAVLSTKTFRLDLINRLPNEQRYNKMLNSLEQDLELLKVLVQELESKVKAEIDTREQKQKKMD